MSQSLKCKFCGREVRETVHSKKIPAGYLVDYYLVWTGELSPIVMRNPRDEREVMRFFKMEHSYPVVACADCCQKPEVERELDRAFSEAPKADLMEEGNEE